jgi:hypothetical protein
MKIYLLAVLSIVIGSGLAPGQWDDTRKIAYIDADMTITGDWTFTGETVLNYVEVDSLVINYLDADYVEADSMVLSAGGKYKYGDGSTYWILSSDDVLDLYINSTLAGRFNSTSFTIGANATVDTVRQLVLPAGKTAVSNPNFTFGVWGDGMLQSIDNKVSIVAGGWAYNFTASAFYNSSGFSTAQWCLSNSIPTATTPNILPWNSDSNTGIGYAGADSLSLIAGGVEIMRLPEGGRNYPQAMAGGMDLIEQSSLPASFVAGTVMVANDSMFISFDGSTWLNVVTQARKP